MDFTSKIRRMIYAGIGMCVLVISISLVGDIYLQTKKIIDKPQIKKVMPIYQMQEVIRHE